jgi:hypothetical protein
MRHAALPAHSTWTVRTVAFALFLITAAVNLQAPLYAAYAKASHMGAGAQTLAFACYVAGLIPSLLLLGGLSDRVGRKLPLMVGLALSAAATALTMRWPRLEALAIARGCCGVATALMTGSGTQFLVELLGSGPQASTRAARIVAATTSLGFGSGSLATGLCLVAFHDQTTPPTYGGYLIIAAIGFVALCMIRQPTFARSSSWVRLPVFRREARWYSVAILIAWSAAGMTIALVPAALSSQHHEGWAGFSAFFVISTGFVVQPLARKLSSLRALAVGLLLVPIGFSLLITAVFTMSLPLLMAGAMLTGAACYGFIYLAGLAAISTSTNSADRARASAGYFLFAYAGFSVPVVLSGALADRLGVPSVLVLFDCMLTLTTALFGTALWRRCHRIASSSDATRTSNVTFEPRP